MLSSHGRICSANFIANFGARELYNRIQHQQHCMMMTRQLDWSTYHKVMKNTLGPSVLPWMPARKAPAGALREAKGHFACYAILSLQSIWPGSVHIMMNETKHFRRSGRTIDANENRMLARPMTRLLGRDSYEVAGGFVAGWPVRVRPGQGLGNRCSGHR